MSERWKVDQGDCIQWMDSLPADYADLVFGSPPYCDARTYGIDAVYDCQQWVDWMLRVTESAMRISQGLVLWVAAGVQREKCYWPACEGLMWEWWKRGKHLWRPCIWWKVDEEDGGTAIPGSGGRQWLRNDWEYVMAFKREGWLPWADNTVMGHPPVYSRVGGAMSNRNQDGQRINAKVGQRLINGQLEEWMDDPYGEMKSGPTRRKNGKYKHVARDDEPLMPPGPVHGAEGNLERAPGRPFPKIANPGNCIIVKARVGGGHIGSPLAHKNEAPFPEKLADFFIRSFCPPDGLAVDPFSGSGTTGACAKRWQRRFHGCDLRQSQVELSRLRIAEETPDLFPTI